MADANTASQLSSQDEGEDEDLLDPPPQLIVTNRRTHYKVGDKISLELRNVSSERVIVITVIPNDIEIDDSQNLVDEGAFKRYTLVPRKYGAYKVTIQMEDSDDIMVEYIHVVPMGDLKSRVTGYPKKVQLPRDILVDKTDLIIADGIRRKVLTMRKEGADKEEFVVPPCENFSPIGLAMKKDAASAENDEIYVTDLNNACVHVYHGPKVYLDSFGKNVLKRPTGIAIDDDGYIYVADHEAKQIFQFTPDYELVRDDSPHELAGPQLMTIKKYVTPSGAEFHSLLVADRTGSTVSIFNIERPNEDDPVKKLIHVTDLNVDIDASCKSILPFSVACDPDNHIFIAGQVITQIGERKGFIWFKDNNSCASFSGVNIIDWPFGGGLRNPGGMRIVEEDGDRYLYVTDMRGKNANNCINKYLL